MAGEKYVLNKHTLQYEKLQLSTKQKLVRGLGYLSIIMAGSALLFSFSHKIFPTPKEQLLENQLAQMEKHFASVTNEFELISGQVEDLQQKDAEVHRVIFGMDPLDESIWEGGTGGSEKYNFVTKFKNSGELLEQTLERIDKLKYKLNLQKNSLDTIYHKALEREDRLRSVPSIKPIQEDKLKRKIRYLSGYGYRIHPVHKVKKFHKGIDFTAPTGTAIQATGNGVVKKIEKKKKGYGYNVLINHGYGFETLYAHMHTIDVKKGEKVTKGHKIGTVGSTGTSTAPHCHYEVRKNGKSVNPIDYCMDGLSIEEYHELVLKAEAENVSID
jgi:murein DD-endopeptidase MepM/ murein hydrolase activator NlpD